jgi:predicted secreted hydrolase
MQRRAGLLAVMAALLAANGALGATEKKKKASKSERKTSKPVQRSTKDKGQRSKAESVRPKDPARTQAAPGPRPLVFPRDHGAHPEARTEWWYATGWLTTPQSQALRYGFQVTFFRSRTDVAAGNTSRFAARQLLFAHAAITDVQGRQLHHAQRIARWSGAVDAAPAAAASTTTRVHIGAWRFEREADGAYLAKVADEATGLAYALTLAPTQPLLLQGQAGWSQKGPSRANASRYYSQPQLAVQGQITLAGATQAVQGRAWLDHEWSESLMPEGAVGWDWIGMNLDDGSALTAFQLRSADGGKVWAGGSHRAPNQTVQAFDATQLQFTPVKFWVSPATRARYPVAWRVQTPVGVFEVQALVDAQELNGAMSTGSVYWEGISALLRDGQRVGHGYLEMTGYAAPLRL